MKTEMVIRIGNSSVECADMKGRSQRFSHRQFASLLAMLKAKKPDRVWVASVVPALTKKLKSQCKRARISFREVRSKDVPLRLPYTKSLGVDRALNVFSLSLRSRTSFALVDLGTATTVEFYDHRRGYLGGWIAPGISMLIEALAEKTALLPRISMTSIDLKTSRWGRTTKESLQLGIRASVYGLLHEVEETARQILKGRSLNLYLTGGAAPHLKGLSKWKRVSGLQLEALRKMAENE